MARRGPERAGVDRASGKGDNTIPLLHSRKEGRLAKGKKGDLETRRRARGHPNSSVYLISCSGSPGCQRGRAHGPPAPGAPRSPARAPRRRGHRRPRQLPAGRDYISSGARAWISLGLGKVVPRHDANSVVPGWSGPGRQGAVPGPSARPAPAPAPPARAHCRPAAARRPERRTKVTAERGANSPAGGLGPPAARTARKGSSEWGVRELLLSVPSRTQGEPGAPIPLCGGALPNSGDSDTSRWKGKYPGVHFFFPGCRCTFFSPSPSFSPPPPSPISFKVSSMPRVLRRSAAT